MIFLKIEKEFFNVFDDRMFARKIEGTDFSDHSNLKTLTPKQVLQKLPIAPTQVKVVNTSEKGII